MAKHRFVLKTVSRKREQQAYFIHNFNEFKHIVLFLAVIVDDVVQKNIVIANARLT